MSNLTRFNHMFDDTFLNNFFTPLLQKDGGKMPAIDVHETDTQYLVKVDLPGVKKEDINVSMSDGMLTIKAETQKSKSEEKDGKIVRQERFSGSFLRQFTVGNDVEPANVKAEYTDGVLSLTLNKSAPSKPALQEIKVS